MADNFWDESRVERLKELYHAGFTASTIASRLGAASRNVIIGKIHRLGLNTPENKPPPKPKAEPKPKAPAKSRQQMRSFLPRVVEVKPIIERPAPPEIPAPLMIKFLDLASNHCRHPIGDPRDPEFGFCGHKQVAGKSYCAGHCQLNYQPPVVREAKKKQTAA